MHTVQLKSDDVNFLQSFLYQFFCDQLRVNSDESKMYHNLAAMSLIVDLPFDVCNEILCEWCSSSEIAFLDTAFCSKVFRPMMLDCLRGIGAIRLPRFNSKSLYWVVNRKLQLTNMIMEKSFHDSIAYDKICSPLRWTYLESLVVRRVDESTCKVAAIVANSSEKLTELIVTESSDVLSLLNSATLARLKGLSFYGLIDNKIDVITSKELEKLQLFAFDILHSVNVIPQLIAIVASNPLLRVCELSVGSNDLLKAILTSCPLIEEIQLINNLSLSEFRTTLLDHPYLKRLEFLYFLRYVNSGRGAEIKIERYNNAANDLNAFLDSFSDLRKLKVGEGVNFTEETLLSLLDHASETLEILDIQRCPDLDEVLPQVVQRCPKLLHFECFVVDGGSAHEIFSAPNQLRYVGIHCEDDYYEDLSPLTLRCAMNIIKSCPLAIRFNFGLVRKSNDFGEFYAGYGTVEQMKAFLYDLKVKGRKLTCNLRFSGSTSKVLNFKHGFFGGNLDQSLLTDDEMLDGIFDYDIDDDESDYGDRPLTPLSDFDEDRENECYPPLMEGEEVHYVLRRRRCSAERNLDDIDYDSDDVSDDDSDVDVFNDRPRGGDEQESEGDEEDADYDDGEKSAENVASNE